MSPTRHPRIASVALCLVGLTSVVAQPLLAGPAFAGPAPTVSKLELKAGQLRIEGTASTNGLVVVASTTSLASGYLQQGGKYNIQKSGFSAPDCYVTVRGLNSSPDTTARISGCTPSLTPVPARPGGPSGSCVINPVPAQTLRLHEFSAVPMTTTGCDRSQSNVMHWTLVAGGIPTGMSGPDAQGQGQGMVSGIPGLSGTYRYTVQVTDDQGQTDQETVAVTVQ